MSRMEDLFKAIDRLNWTVPERVQLARHEHGQRLAEAGWSYPSSFSLEQIEKLATNDLSDNEIDEWMIKIYCHDEHKILQNMINETVLSDEFADIMDIERADFSEWAVLLQEALQCFLEQRYLITIPALITIIEGTLRKELEITGTRVIQPVKDKSEQSHSMIFEETNWKTLLAVIEPLYRRVEFTSSIEPELNRHWVMHGKATPKQAKLSSLKLFNIVGTLATCNQ